MAERGGAPFRRGTARASRNASRSGSTDRRDAPTSTSTTAETVFHPHPAARYNPSLRSAGSRVSLTEQFAITKREYEFGFDDAVSFVAQSDYVDDDDDDDHEDTLTGAESFDGAVVVEPPTPRAEPAPRLRRRNTGEEKVARSHYELLCLPPEGGVMEGDVRRAYFRLYDILRSWKMPAPYRDVAEDYFDDVQGAFETLIGESSKEEYDHALVDEEDDTNSDAGDELGSNQDGKVAQASRGLLSPQFVRRLRRQQEQEVTEVGLQMNAQPLFSSTAQQSRGNSRMGSVFPAAFSVTHTHTRSLPSISRHIEPKARKLRDALRDPAVTKTKRNANNDDDLELYLTPPTVTLSSSIFAGNARSTYLPPTRTISQYQNLLPESLATDRPLEWYSAFLAPLFNLKLRQELFLRPPNLPLASLRRTLPDAVVELDTDTLNAASMTARASYALRIDEEKHKPDEEHPVQVEASVSVNRSWLAGNFATRLGIAAHKRSQAGGMVFACADTGTSALWETTSFWKMGQADSKLAAGWRSYMDQLSRSLYSPPTVEVGYRFSHSPDVAGAVGLNAGRAFTRQARNGLRRLHDDVDLVGVGKGGSWTVSGAVTDGGVAAYLRYAKDLFASGRPLSASSTDDDANSRSLLSRWKDALGIRMEVELTVQKMRNNSLLNRVSRWGQAEFSNLAVRGLKRIGRTHKVGLELGVSSASNSVVVSFYLSKENKRRLVIPVALLRDTSTPSTSYTKALFWAAFLPALGIAAVDHVLAARQAALAKRKKGSKSKRAALKTKEYERVQASIAHCRTEADHLVTVLAEPVLQRQRVQRERAGLVILSAKYGVLLDDGDSIATAGPNWATPEDVADVTVAVAALVDEDATLCIPEGLRKSRILGFWDPKPGCTKHLVVKFLSGGKEGTRFIRGREELRLP